jgi:hypothetical protein
MNDGLLDNINESEIYFLCLNKLWVTQVTTISKVQCLKVQAQWKKKKAKRRFTVSVKVPKGTEEKAVLKGTTGMNHFCGSVK